MQTKIFYLLLFVFNYSYSQTISYVIEDIDTFDDIAIAKNKDYILYEKTISDGTDKSIYLFKIDNLNDNEEYVIVVNNDRVRKTTLFDKSLKKQDKLKNTRYNTYKFKGKISPFFLKIETTKEAYIPVKIFDLNDYHQQEQINFLIIGGYFGFLLLIVILNLYYFFNFKELSFLFYALFVITLGAVFFINDGMLQFFKVSYSVSSYLESFFTYITVFFLVIFASIYLQVSKYIPKLNYVFCVLLIINFINLLLFFYTQDFTYLKWLDLLGLFILILCWLTGVYLYKQNMHIKVFAWAYFFILILGINFYGFRVLGITFYNINTKHLKMGAIIEMLTLSYAVVYRMRVLKNEYENIRLELDEYIKKFSSLSTELLQNKKEETLLLKYNLSIRETEVLHLVCLGKTNKIIAEELFISINTVKTHIRNIYEKLDINNRKEIKVKFKKK